MAVFEIEHNGKTYQIEAPSMEAAVEALSGFAQPSGGSSVNQANLARFQEGAKAFGRGAVQGATMRFGDEIAGPLRAASAAFQDGGLTAPVTPEAMAAEIGGIRAQNQQSQAANPTMYGAGEIGGSFIPALAASPLATGSTPFRTFLQSAALGGAEGAAFGAGGADGEPMAESVRNNAIVGAILGAGAPVAVGTAGAIRRRITDPVAGAMNLGNQARAGRFMDRTLARSGRSVDELQADILEAGRAMQPEFRLMDALGETGQSAASGVARTPSAGARELREFLEQRQLDAGDRMSTALADQLEAPDTALQREAALRAARSEAADINYSAARESARPVDVRGALSVLDDRLAQTAGMEGTGFTGDGVDSVFARFRNRLAADRVPSDIDAMELSDFDRVLGVKQDMQDAAEAARRAGRNNEAREIGRVVAELDRALEASSDAYRTANDTFRAQSQAIDAVGQGAAATRPSARATDVVERFRNMTPDQQAAFRAGTADRLINRIEGQATGANVAAPLMRTRTDEILGALARDPEALRAQIARENIMAQTRARATGGSRTADNMADIEDVNTAGDIGIVSSWLMGQPGAAIGEATRRVAATMSGRNEETNRLIAQMLMSNDPRSVLQPIVNKANRSKAENRVLEAIVRNLAAPAAGARE